jgi:NAD(P)-dependent dehydrogenase (short-subunit alcohol dehydrogenase family)
VSRRALVTGASSGIGAATVTALARAGWRVLATGRDRDRLAAVAQPLGESVEAVVADLTDDAGLARLVAAARAEPLHALVHAAGVIALGPLTEAEPSDVSWQWRVNVLAPIRLSQALVPSLRESGGHLLFVNSGAGRRANAGWGAYAASKFALRAVADAWRAEEAPHGVRVTSVYPGRTDTPMQRAVFAAEGRPYDASGTVPASVVAEAIALALAAPASATWTDLDVRAS